jgi:hypothetical protein
MQTPYQHAYAKLHPADCSYAGKLYAELDAIRDAWMAPIVRGDK